MEIIPFERGHVADVTRLVNAQIAFVPPHWQLSEAQVWDILQKDSLWEIHYADEEPSPWTWSNEIICVVDNDRVLAAGRMDYRYDDSRLVMVSGRWLVSDPNILPPSICSSTISSPNAARALLKFLSMDVQTLVSVGVVSLPLTTT